MSHIGDNNPDAPDAALLGPGTTATGAGTALGSVHESAEGEDHIPPLDRSSHDETAASPSAD
ncbi:hypothetical protein [Mycetocola zhadangensis]|uniref:Uncharacterized protein n=1 Tax=Mycetocola zhadangensis TaxID=1164595 RepID=A0A3L7ISN9_9MICO|nr:hypothetical protein [Mycetocola zhadangensis]RLQ81120.1 hypothetical protein D9V28_15380 [Mycetocola zhadangensis]GGF04957.1 hypothetical protein GCM10011313_30090 [Mycetocola zhadangensis]